MRFLKFVGGGILLKRNFLTDSIDTFKDPLETLLLFLEKEKIPHVLIGGIAVSQLSEPRLTADIDVLALLDDDNRIQNILDDAAHYGFTPRLKDAAQFARKNRVLLLEHQSTGIPIDISLGVLPFEMEVVDRRSSVKAGDLVLPLPTVEDLIILKAVAHRPLDLADINALLDAHKDTDHERILRIVSEFAEVLEMPEILDDLRKLL